MPWAVGPWCGDFHLQITHKVLQEFTNVLKSLKRTKCFDL
jgi:hypothetical protein